MTHLILQGEEKLHVMATNCKCNPEIVVTDGGEMICTHAPLINYFEPTGMKNRATHSKGAIKVNQSQKKDNQV